MISRGHVGTMAHYRAIRIGQSFDWSLRASKSCTGHYCLFGMVNRVFRCSCYTSSCCTRSRQSENKRRSRYVRLRVMRPNFFWSVVEQIVGNATAVALFAIPGRSGMTIWCIGQHNYWNLVYLICYFSLFMENRRRHERHYKGEWSVRLL